MNPEIIALIAVVAVVIALWRVRSAGTITGDRARRLVEEGARLVDVRSPAEYASGHIAGAVNIPVQDLSRRLQELGRDKTKPVIVYCRSGARSANAQQILAKAGFTQVDNLGPMSRW